MQGRSIIVTMVKNQSKDPSLTPPAETSLSPTADESNWQDLAEHFREKVSKRTSEIAYLQTRSGFIIAASVLVLQSALSLLSKDDTALEVIFIAAAFVLALFSLILAIISMHISKSPTPLNPDAMIMTLTEQPKMSRRNFSNWLAKSYAKTNTEFNKSYGKKYGQQIWSAILIVVALILIAIVKGMEIYV